MPHSSIHAIPKANHLLGGELAAGDAVQRIYTLDGYDVHPSGILVQHSRPEHRLGDLYDYMLLRDTVLAALWRARARATTGLPRFIFPADESDRAREVAIFCRDALGLIPNFHTNLTLQLRGITEGIAFDELIWERLTRGPLAGALVPVDAIDRPMHRFLFKRGQLHVLRAGFQTIPVPPSRIACGTARKTRPGARRSSTRSSGTGRSQLDLPDPALRYNVFSVEPQNLTLDSLQRRMSTRMEGFLWNFLASFLLLRASSR